MNPNLPNQVYEEGQAKFAAIKTDYERQIAAKDERIAALEDAGNVLLATIDAHETQSIDCDRSRQTSCDCLDRAVDKLRAALASGKEAK